MMLRLLRYFAMFLATGAVLAMLLPFIAHGQSDANAAIDDPQDFVLWNAAYVEATADRLYKSLHDKDLVWEIVGMQRLIKAVQAALNINRHAQTTDLFALR